MAQQPLVALVGRPNVGKSTLFNRIVGQRLAVVHNRPGTTRDRQEAEGEWLGVTFTLIDTGGIEALETVGPADAEPLAEDSAQFLNEMRGQAELAIDMADVIVFVVDVTTGITAADQEIADLLRRSNKPIIVAANKGENVDRHIEAAEFYSLGVGEVFPISAMHGTGVGDMLDAVIDALPFRPDETFETDDSLKLAIVGRPNVGKSSLLNQLLGKERVIVSPVAGTTRDSIDTKIMWEGEPITLIDTAGIRRRGKIERTVERWSVVRALKAIKRADVALLVVDAEDGITAQDTHVAGYILEELKSVVVLVNKWDAIEKDTYTMIEYTKLVRRKLRFIPYAPVLFISALTGQRVQKVLPTVNEVWEGRHYRIPTAEMNRMVREALMAQPPQVKGGRPLKIRYASQVATAPPKFVFHVNDPDLVHFTYQRYLENRIRRVYPFTGTPLLMDFRASSKDRQKKRDKS